MPQRMPNNLSYLSKFTRNFTLNPQPATAAPDAEG